MGFIHFNKATSAKTWVSHLNPEDGRSQHPDWIFPTSGWMKSFPDKGEKLTPTSGGSDGRGDPQLHLGTLLPSQSHSKAMLHPAAHPATAQGSAAGTKTTPRHKSSPKHSPEIDLVLIILFCRDKCLILWLLTLEMAQPAPGWILAQGTWPQP